MTELPDIDISARTQRLGVPLTPREHTALHDACAEAGKVAAVVVRQLLRSSGYLPPWSVEGDQRPAPGKRAPKPVEPRAHLYAGLVGRWVDLERPMPDDQRVPGGSETYGLAGIVVEVRDTDQGVEVLMDWGMAALIKPDDTGWRFIVRADDPAEHLKGS